MFRHVAAGIAGLVLCLGLAGQARATQICAWLVESVEGDDLHKVDLWLQADGEIEFLYKIGGQGLLDGSGKSHSPSSASYFLRPGKGERVWGFGATLSPPGKIDIVAELHQKPADIFDEKPTPLIASFAFRRDVPDGETKPPPVLAKKQCATVK